MRSLSGSKITFCRGLLTVIILFCNLFRTKCFVATVKLQGKYSQLSKHNRGNNDLSLWESLFLINSKSSRSNTPIAAIAVPRAIALMLYDEQRANKMMTRAFPNVGFIPMRSL